MKTILLYNRNQEIFNSFSTKNHILHGDFLIVLIIYYVNHKIYVLLYIYVWTGPFSDLINRIETFYKNFDNKQEVS